MRPGLSLRLHLFEQFAALLDAGLPVLRSLQSLGPRAGSARLTRMMAEARLGVEHGATLTEALAAQPGLLDPVHVRILEACERTGRLEEGIRGIAGDLETGLALRRSLLQGLRYPALLLHAALLIPPVPILVMEGTLPYLRAVLPALLSLYGLALGAWLAWTMIRGRPRIAEPLRSIAEALPLLGTPLRRLSSARLFGALHVTVSAALPPAECLRVSMEASGNPRWASAGRQADALIAGGARLHEVLRRLPGLDPLAADQVETGEESGKLDEALGRLARRGREDAEFAFKTLAGILQKGIYFLVVGAVAYSILKGFGAIQSQTMAISE